MHTSAIIQEIQKLPLNKKFLIVEQTIKAIKNEDISQQMSIVAEELYTAYCKAYGGKFNDGKNFQDGKSFQKMKKTKTIRKIQYRINGRYFVRAKNSESIFGWRENIDQNFVK